MRTYQIDTKAAQAAHTGSNRLSDSGAYKGTIKAAFCERSRGGADGVFFVFDAGEGREPALLSLYTHDKDGKPLMGYDTLNAIMACVKVRTLEPSKGEVELYDFDARGMVKKPKDVFAALAGKPLGLLLQQEEYLSDGQVKTSLKIVGAFEAATSLMANEILSKITTPAALAKASDWLAKNPLRALRKKPAANGADASQYTGSTLPDGEECPW